MNAPRLFALKYNFIIRSSYRFLIFLLLGTSFVLGEVERDQNKRPDILFILLDDLRWDAMSFMGHPYIETPNIDKLRQKGAWMQNAFVTTSICCPSRATFLTGTLASRHGVIDNETAEYNPDITPPLSKYLQENGYKTAMIGKWHMGYYGHPRPYFDYWLSFDGQGKYYDPVFIIDGKKQKVKGYTTDLLTDHAIDFIKAQSEDEPYFVMLSHKAVHEPFRPAERHKDAFGADTMDPEPVSWSDDFENKPDWQKRQRIRDVRWDWRTRDLEGEELPEKIAPEPWEERSKYVEQSRCAAAVDDGIGEILEMLEKRGTLNNTLIIFASDNGYFHMEHRRWDKRLAYEESLRIPMLWVYPEHIEPGSTVEQMVTNADFAPTVLGYAGIPTPGQMQGEDMRPLFESEDSEWREQIFYEYWTDLVHSIPTMAAVRNERYKLIQYPEINDLDELYDLENDPYEMNNLVVDPDYADLHKEMQGVLRNEKLTYGWRPDVFPRNLPSIRGVEGVLLDLVVEDGALVNHANLSVDIDQNSVEVVGDSLVLEGSDNSHLVVPFMKETDPAGWPYRIDISLKPESDGVVASQSNGKYGYKVFIQDGRPGVSVRCTTWIATTTTIDAPQLVLGEWTHLQVLIDYNRLTFLVNGVVAETLPMPMPLKVSPKAPLVIGASDGSIVAESVSMEPIKAEIRRVTVQRSRFE